MRLGSPFIGIGLSGPAVQQPRAAVNDALNWVAVGDIDMSPLAAEFTNRREPQNGFNRNYGHHLRSAPSHNDPNQAVGEEIGTKHNRNPSL